MKCDVDLQVLPYDAQDGGTLLDRIVSELGSGRWDCLRGAIAFLRSSALYEVLVAALRHFGENGGAVELTFGADVFGDQSGSDYEAVATLLSELGGLDTFRLHLYREPGRTFHPKLLLFSNPDEALLVTGSSNWTDGGLINNVEVNTFVALELHEQEHREAFDRLVLHFTSYWQGPEVEHEG